MLHFLKYGFFYAHSLLYSIEYQKHSTMLHHKVNGSCFISISGLTKVGEVGEILALYQMKSPLFLFACCSFLANNLCFMVKLIDRAIVINVKIPKNDRKRLYSSNKENLISITAIF